jgi:PAS domain S-box-containing protein
MAGAAGAIGALALIGTFLGIGLFTSVGVSLVAIKVNTAVSLVLAALSLGVQARPVRSRALEGLALASALLVATVGLATLIEYAGSVQLGIDQLLWQEAPGAVGTVDPGRPAPNTALGLFLLGLALLRTDGGGWRRSMSQLSGLAALAVAALGVVGYAAGAVELYGLQGHTPVALNTAVALALLAAGCLAARPERGFVRLLTVDGPGGQLARRLLLVVGLAPLVLLILLRQGKRLGLFEDPFDDALHVVLLTGLLVVLVWHAARSVDDVDGRRREAERQRLELAAQEREAKASAAVELAARIEAEDLAERAEAGERRASAERERLDVTLCSIGDAVIATDNASRITVFNPVAEKLTGWKAAQAMGRPLGEVFRIVSSVTREPGEDPVARALASGQTTGLANHTLLVARDGTERSIADSSAPIRDGGRRIVGAVLVFRDVTDEERRDRALARTQRLESLAVLAGGIAHDFNNMLTGVLANLGVAVERTRDQDVLEVLADVRNAAERARGLTKQLLTFANGGAPVKELTDLETLVRETVQFSTHGWPGACHFELAPGLWHGLVDPGQVAQVVQNVVINAVQAMPTGGRLIVAADNLVLDKAEAAPLREGPFVRIRIADEGPGIPEPVRERIFEPFYSTKPHGSGLGLAVCHSVVSKHDGRIDVISREGAGTTFDVYFPARPEARAAVAASSVPPLVAGARILVMDDEPAIRRAVARALRPACETVGAASGEEAVERFREARAAGKPFALVILDLTVPGGMGGVETLRALRRIDRELPAVVSSGFSSDPIMASHAERGFAAVLAKPYEPAQLREVVARVLSAHRASGVSIAS